MPDIHVTVYEREEELLKTILKKSSKAGFKNHSGFWLKLFLVRLWGLDEKKFLECSRCKRKM